MCLALHGSGFVCPLLCVKPQRFEGQQRASLKFYLSFTRVCPRLVCSPLKPFIWLLLKLSMFARCSVISGFRNRNGNGVKRGPVNPTSCVELGQPLPSNPWAQDDLWFKRFWFSLDGQAASGLENMVGCSAMRKGGPSNSSALG